MKKVVKQKQEFDYPVEIAKLAKNIQNIVNEIATELKLEKDIFSVDASGFGDYDYNAPAFMVSAADIQNSLTILGRNCSYLFSADDAFKKELMFCLKFALAVNENVVDGNYYVLNYFPLEHTFMCSVFSKVGGPRGTYIDVKFDPYGDTLSGEVEYGYKLPESQRGKYRTSSQDCESLLPIIETDIIQKLVVNTNTIMCLDVGRADITGTRRWLTTQLTYLDVCVEARTILLLALEKLDVKSTNIERYIDMFMGPKVLDPAHVSTNHNAIIRFKLLHGDTDVFNVVIFQKDYEKQLVIIDGDQNRLEIDLNKVSSYHRSIEMMINFIRR